MKKITIMSLVMMAMLIIISCSKDDDVTDGNHGNDGGGGSPIVTVVINEDGTSEPLLDSHGHLIVTITIGRMLLYWQKETYLNH